MTLLERILNRENLTGSRWILQEPLQRKHVVEIVEVRRRKVHIATVYSFPFRHWWTDRSLLQSPCMLHIGYATDFEWVHPMQWAITTGTASGQYRAWLIHQVNGATVYMYPKRNPDTTYPLHCHVGIEHILTNFRQATNEERQEARELYRVSGTPEIVIGDLEPEPESKPEPEGPRPHAWDRLGKE